MHVLSAASNIHFMSGPIIVSTVVSSVQDPTQK